MNILICDDQKDEIEQLTALLGETGYDLRIQGFTGGKEAFEYVSGGGEPSDLRSAPLRASAHGSAAADAGGSPVDVCFLDIVMPTMDGIQLAEKLREGGFSGEIVFLTSSNDYAHESYGVNAFTYLLKPPTPKSVRDVLAALEETRKNADRKGLPVKTQGGATFVLFRDISHAEVIDHIVHIRLCNGDEIKAYTTFAGIAGALLSDSRFVQCHRSFIVNVSDIKTVSSRDVLMKGGARVPVSKGYAPVKKTMMKWMVEGGRK